MSIPSWSGARYLLMFTNEFSRKTFGNVLKFKFEVLNKFKEFKTMTENQLNLRIKRLRTDNGKEYCNESFSSYLKHCGIIHETTIPYNAEQNGVSERNNRTIIEEARTMLEDAGLDRRYWAEAVNTAIYLKNKSPTVAVENATPEELWISNKVNLKHLRVFGCRVLAHIPKELRTKLDPKSKECIMVGYSETSKGYRLTDPKRPGKLIVARSVKFIEHDINYIKTNDSSETTCLDEPLQLIQEQNTNVVQDCGSNHESDHDSNHEESFDCANDDVTNTVELRTNPEQGGTLPVRNRRPLAWMKDYDASFYVSTDINSDPEIVQDALNGPLKEEWKKAMRAEYESLLKNNVWELVERPRNHNVIKSKWMFKTKRNASGVFERFKARLVARGFTQKYVVDHKETFSSVVRHSTIRTLFAMANEYDLDTDHVDITTAFLNVDIGETIYMEQPEGFNVGDKVCLLRKSMA